MPELVLHQHTAQELDNFASRPSHAVLLLGPAGIGKSAVAQVLAARLLSVSQRSLAAYPHLRRITSTERKAIGIEAVRELEHFLSLKIPGAKQIARIAIIEDAHLLTTEAQNALLKTLEEPPADTVLILTSSQEQELLPTIRSRLQSIAIKKPKLEALLEHFSNTAAAADMQQALAVSGGLPGLTNALLQEEAAHPLVEAVQVAKQLLQAGQYERLLLVDALAKRKVFCREVCFILMQMAQVSLQRGTGSDKRWQAVLVAAYKTEEQLLGNAQPKLVLTNLMLSL